MSREFLVRFLIAGRDNKLDLDAGRWAIDRLRITPLEDWPEDFLGSQIGGVPEDLDQAERMKHHFVDLLVADLRMVEEELSDGVGRSDLWAGRMGNKFFMMSGGPSWRDAPEAYRSLDRLASAGITQAMGGDW